MSLNDIELKLRDEAAFGRSAHQSSSTDSEYLVDLKAVVQEICVISVVSWVQELSSAKVVSVRWSWVHKQSTEGMRLNARGKWPDQPLDHRSGCPSYG